VTATDVTRSYGRTAAQLRPTTIQPDFMQSATGSALITQGETRVICTASVEESVPRWMEGRGTGWVTAEYGMLPASTGQRKQRDSTKGRPDGRTVEIQRLIGRSLRAAVDMKALGERTVWIDCDVLTADGGTRCAAITGGYVALAVALRSVGAEAALTSSIAAISAGMVDGTPVLDLDYAEDSDAETDMNVVMNNGGAFIELQGTAEGHAFRRHELDALLDLAAAGIGKLFTLQSEALGG
jgi:ribonuclease PH